MNISIRCNSLFVKLDDIYLMKNPFTGAWEIIADTAETLDASRKDGRLNIACRRIAQLAQNKDTA